MSQVLAAQSNSLQGGGGYNIPESMITQSRKLEEKKIQDKAARTGVTVDEVCTLICDNYLDFLGNFIRHQGEAVVSEDPTAVALQATLLRALQISSVANSLGVDDYDALCVIESGESELVKLDNYEAQYVMPDDLAAAIALALDHMSDEDMSEGRSGTMSDILSNISSLGDFFASQGQSNQFMYAYAGVNHSDGDDATDTDNENQDAINNEQAMDAVTSPDPTHTSIGGTLAAIPGVEIDPGIIAPQQMGGVATTFPSISDNASNLPKAGTTTTEGGLLNSISAVLTGITTVANQATTAANATGGAAGAIKAAATQVGANAIATYVKNNWGVILFAVLIIIGIIYAVAHSRKGRS